MDAYVAVLSVFIDGGTAGTIKAGTEAAKEVVPLASQYPIAFALVACLAFAVWCVRIFQKRDQARSVELKELTGVVSEQNAIIAAQNTQLDTLLPILSSQIRLEGQMKSDAAELLKARERYEAAEREIERLRNKRKTGAVRATSAPDGDGT